MMRSFPSPRLLFLAAALLALAVFLVHDAPYTAAQSPPSLLDTSFGTGGKVITGFNSGDDFGKGVAVQPDGRIVVGGQSDDGTVDAFSAARYNADGSLDNTFGTGGKATIAIGSISIDGKAMALQPDGKVVVAGTRGDDFAVARFTAAGAPDTTFGTVVSGSTRSGHVTTAIGSGRDLAFAVAVQRDRKIVVAGYSQDEGGGSKNFAVVRYNANGSLDTGFGSGGKVVTAFGTDSDEANAVAVQSDGKIVVAGYSTQGTNLDFAVVRYNANGSLDTGFGSDGKVTTAIGRHTDIAYAVAVQSDGRIVAAGEANSGIATDFAVVRYMPDGSLDASFGTGGKATADFDSGADIAHAVAVDSDGKIVLAGQRQTITGSDFAVARYTASGALDTTFTADGKVTTDINSRFDTARGVVVQSDGEIVVAGTSRGANGRDFAVVRYLPPPTLLTLSASGTLREGGGPVTITYTLDQPAPCYMGATTTFGGTASGLVVQNDWYLEGDRLEKWIEEFNEQNDPDVSGEPDLDVDFGFSRPPHIERGETTATQTIVVIDDDVVDHGETLALSATMSPQRGCAVQALKDDINFTIRDNERKNGRSDPSSGRAGSASPTRLTLTADKTSVSEGEDSVIRVNATLDKPALSPTSVMVAFSGTATRNPNNTSDDGNGFAREGDYDVYSGSAQEYRILINQGETTALARDAQGNIQTELPMAISLYDDGEVERTETIILTATVEEPELTHTLTLSIRDNDRAGVTVSPTTLPAAQGDFAYYTVKLDSRPTADVTITPTSGNTGRVTVSPATLTFTSSNWNRAQRVTATRVAPGSATIAHRAASDDSNYRRTVSSVTVNDPPAADPTHVTLHHPGPVAEDVGTVTITARVDAPTLSAVTVTVEADRTSTATATADYTGLPATITIGRGQYEGTATITIVDDTTAEPDEFIRFAGTSPGRTVGSRALVITINDGCNNCSTGGEPSRVPIPQQQQAGKYAELIAQMYEWRNDPQWVSHKSHTDRWDRALLALGETVADASLTPMTGDEAQALADQAWGTRWVPVAAAIKDIESGGQQQQEQTPQEKYASLIAQMYEWRNDPQWVSHKSHTDRWDRALLALGETVADASLTPMTGDEAQALADQAWGTRWVPVAAALWDIEGG